MVSPRGELRKRYFDEQDNYGLVSMLILKTCFPVCHVHALESNITNK